MCVHACVWRGGGRSEHQCACMHVCGGEGGGVSITVRVHCCLSLYLTATYVSRS